jgi:hypothetical protein
MTLQNKPEMEKIRDESRTYIEAYQARQAGLNGNVTTFGQLCAGAPFTLPGGTTRQVKLNERQAATASRLVLYAPWERVVALPERVEA